jgi:hypothetical protein
MSYVQRSTNVAETPGRYAILGSTNYTDTEVSFSFLASSATVDVVSSAVARYVDASNLLRLQTTNAGSSSVLSLVQRVAGTETTLGSVTWSRAWDTHVFRLLVFASGRAIGQVLSVGGALQAQVEGSSSALATSGALDDGKPGFHDQALSTGTVTRLYGDFSVSVPPSEPVVIYSGRNMQIRHDDTIRQDSTGTYTGRPASYRGSRFLVPVGTSRVLAKVRRNDVETAADDAVTDATQIQVGITPRGLAVPRS